jgi:molybdate transport system ATP-binding protein
VNLSVGRLTGCKNFFDIEIIGEKNEQFILKSQGLILHANKTRQANSKNMIAGVRAHDLKISSKPFNEINDFECEVIEKIDNVFSTSIIVNCQGIVFQVEVSKYNCTHLWESKCKSLFINIPPEKVFLVNKE